MLVLLYLYLRRRNGMRVCSDDAMAFAIVDAYIDPILVITVIGIVYLLTHW
jgi:hypothetical protein